MELHGSIEGQPARRALTSGILRLGGGLDDDWRIQELPPGGIRFEVLDAAEQWVTIESSQEFALGMDRLLPGKRRMLLPGERLTWGRDCWLELRAPAPTSGPFTQTAQLVRGLLRGEATTDAIPAPTLLALTGRDLGRRYFLAEPDPSEGEDGDGWVIGRGGGLAIRLRDRSVSRRHGRIRRHEGCDWLEDLDSANGITLNGQPLTGPARLTDGDVLGLGYSRLRYCAAAYASAEVTPESQGAFELDPSPVSTDSWVPWPGDGWLIALFASAASLGLYCIFG